MTTTSSFKKSSDKDKTTPPKAKSKSKSIDKSKVEKTSSKTTKKDESKVDDNKSKTSNTNQNTNNKSIPSKPGSKRITKEEAQRSGLSRKQKKLILKLNTAYCRTGKMDRILPILTGKSKISLRLIDWFVTNYAKVNNTHYNISVYKAKREAKDDPKIGKGSTKGVSKKQPAKTTQKKGDKDTKKSYFHDLFFVYPSYRQELKTNSKKRFDVFCRNGSINYYYDDKKFIETNDGQLNFFNWADEMYVIDYIEDHYDDIENDMENRNAKKSLSQKKSSTRGKKKAKTIAVCTKESESQKVSKRREISESALKTIHHIPHRAIISFD